MEENRLKVSEIFHSIQGEGVNAGIPAVFVRLAGCNIHCTKDTVGFNCDTTYAWSEGKEMSVEDVVNEIKKYNCKHIVWTGGEPTLQMKEILDIVSILDTYVHEIETNGTFPFATDYFLYVTVSPKKGYVSKKLLAWFARKNESIFFKFVIVGKEDIDYWLNIMKECKINPLNTFFMPAGTTDEEIKERSLWLVEECKKYEVRFSPRLQIWLYGNVRGR
jgi:organic radical activating enzyme